MLSTVDSKIILKNTKYLQIVNIVNDHRWNVDVWKKHLSTEDSSGWTKWPLRHLCQTKKDFCNGNVNSIILGDI